MSRFVEDSAGVDGDASADEAEDVATLSDDDFIDDGSQPDDDASSHRRLDNRPSKPRGTIHGRVALLA